MLKVKERHEINKIGLHEIKKMEHIIMIGMVLVMKQGRNACDVLAM